MGSFSEVKCRTVGCCREKLLAERDDELQRLKDDIKNLETERASLISKVSRSSSLNVQMFRCCVSAV